jgi:hypothetical protein
MNRHARRAAKAAHLPSNVAVIPVDILFRGEDSADGEELISRGLAEVERQLGLISPEHVEHLRDQMYCSLENVEREERCLLPVTTALHYSDEEFAEGQRRLQRVLPAACARARSEETGSLAQSSVVTAALRDNQFRLADIEAVMIYQARPGAPVGWHADVMFGRELPPLSNIIGTPVDSPCQTREEAEARALGLLDMLVTCAPTREDA